MRISRCCERIKETDIIGHSSRQSFIVAFVSVIFESYPENISALRNLAERFQVGKYQEDRITFCHIQRFWEGYGWILRLMNALDLGGDYSEKDLPLLSY